MPSVIVSDENEAPFSTEGKKIPQYFAGFVATLGAVSAGTYLSWTSSAIPLYKNETTSSAFLLNEDEASWVGALLPLGALFGSIPAGLPADRFGRKKSILFYAVPLLCSWFAIAFAPSCAWLYAGRLLAGIAVGASTVTIPLYLSEIAEPSVRGALGTLMQLQITVGILAAYVIGMVHNLRLICVLSALIPACLLVSFPFMPESPVWLTRKGRQSDAKRALSFLRGKQYDVERELEELRTAKASEGDEKVGLLDLRHHKKELIISVGLMLFQQLSGVNAVIFYADDIFKKAKSAISPTSCSVILGIVQCISTYFSTLAIDKAGRRVLLLISSTVMSVCLLFIAGYFYGKDESVSESGVPWIPLILLGSFLATFSIGFGPIPWMMVGELFPNNVKGRASSIGSTCNWLLAFLVTKVFGSMTEALGDSWTFALFACVCAIATIFVAISVPETKNKTTQEIQDELHGINRETKIVEKGIIANDEGSC